MSMTAVPISILLVRAPMAARSGNGEPSWRAQWCTRKYAPSAPSSSAATASSIDWSSESAAVRTCEWGEGVQCPNDRNPIFFNCTSLFSNELDLFVHVMCWHDTRCLQLYRVDGIAACNEQRPAIRTAECLVRRTGLFLGLAPVDRQVDRAE